MSVSLVAVFIPLLLMGGIVGRLFREFAVTLSVAIVVSMVVSLTATPMMCAHLLKEHESHGWLYQTVENVFNWIVGLYGKTLSVVLRHSFVTLLVLLTTIGLNVYLFVRVPKGFFPQQDNGRMSGQILADQDTSFQSMDKTLLQMVNIVAADPAVDTVNRLYRRRRRRWRRGHLEPGRMFVSLKPLAERKITVDYIMQRLRPKLARIPGATLYLQANQDLRVGGRNSAAQYQFTMRGDNLQDLITYAPRMFQELKTIPIIVDVNSDQQNRGLQSMVTYDRETAARFGISPQLIDNTLYDAFGQRQVSTMYKSLNQYHVVMEAAPAILAESRDLARYLRPRAQRPAGSPERHRPLRPRRGAALGEPPGPVPVGHHLVQPAARRRAGRCRRCHRRGGPQDRSSAHHPDHVHRHRAGLSGFARQRALPDRRGPGGGLPRARHPLRKLHPSRSPFFPRCLRPAWARCWR